MRILIADNDLRVRAALHVLLAEQDDAAMFAECADLEELVRQLREFGPDLVLLDWELPGRAAAAFLLAANQAGARPKLIVLSARPEARSAALAVGADGFVFKADPPEALIAACRHVMGEQAAGALDVETAPQIRAPAGRSSPRA